MAAGSMNADLMAEFKVSALLDQVDEILKGCSVESSSTARLGAAVREAKRMLHPATSDPKLREQFKAETAPPPEPEPEPVQLPTIPPPVEQPPPPTE